MRALLPLLLSCVTDPTPRASSSDAPSDAAATPTNATDSTESGTETATDCPVDPGTTPLLRLPDAWYEAAVEDLLGLTPPDGTDPATVRGPAYRTWVEANPVSDVGVDGYLRAAEDLVGTIAPDALMGCEAPYPCADAWGAAFLEQAFRRPPTPAESALFLGLLEPDPAQGAGALVEAVLQSPQFLYLDLSAEGSPGEVVLLGPDALAARLSFVLLGTPPDESLRADAAAGKLDTTTDARAVVAALLDDPRAADGFAAFHEDWLQLWALDRAVPDPERYPDFDPDLVAGLREELDRFVRDEIFLGDPQIDTLLHSTMSWTNGELASLYGTEGRGGEWRRRDLGARRPGVLTRAGFLTAHGGRTEPSPVRRGVVLLEQVLCSPTPLPPPSAPSLDDEVAATIRERLEAHRADPLCASCHDLIDPLGLSLEHFDSVGAWRDRWHDGTPVDASGTWNDETFDDFRTLLTGLDADRTIRDCYASHWVQWALGRPLEEADSCTVQGVADQLEQAGGDLRELVIAVVTTEAFRTRRISEGT